MSAGERHLLECAEQLVGSHEDLMRQLIAMRKKHHLSQEVVAERMGVSQPTVASFERYDSNPQLSSIRRYALAVGASIEHIVRDSCQTHSGDRFDEIVLRPVEANWQPKAVHGWNWGPSSRVLVANGF